MKTDKDRLAFNATYCHGYPPKAMFICATVLGFDGIEVMLPRGRADEGAGTLLAQLADLVQEYQVPVLAMHDGLFVCTDADTANTEDELATWLTAMRFGRRHLGLEVANPNPAGPLVAPGAQYMDLGSNGSRVATPLHYARCAAALRRLSEVAEETGLHIAIEMHGCSICDTATSTLTLLDMVGSDAVGVNFDYGNLFFVPHAEPLQEMLGIVGHKVFYVHMKNSIRAGASIASTDLDSGEVDCNRLIAGLRGIGYCGIWTLERPGYAQDPYVALHRDLGYLSSLTSRSEFLL